MDTCSSNEDDPETDRVENVLRLCRCLFPGLQWRSVDGYLTARADKAFRDLYRADENRMIEAGFTLHVRKNPSLHIVRFHPRVDRPDNAIWYVLDATRKLLASGSDPEAPQTKATFGDDSEDDGAESSLDVMPSLAVVRSNCEPDLRDLRHELRTVSIRGQLSSHQIEIAIERIDKVLKHLGASI